MGSLHGSTKTSGGGWKSIDENPVEDFVWENTYCDGVIIVYKDLDEHMGICDEFSPNLDLFFISFNIQVTTKSYFFKAQPLGKLFS